MERNEAQISSMRGSIKITLYYSGENKYEKRAF